MFRSKARIRIALSYGIALAAGAFLLQWLEVQYLARRYPTEIYLVLLCGLFTALGIWVGHRLTSRLERPNFSLNHDALTSLGISRREADVLSLLASGNSNQEIADKLHISTNTVKSHLQKLYEKLGVAHRGRAVQKARSLHLVP